MLRRRDHYFCFQDDNFRSEYVNPPIPLPIPEYQTVEPLHVWQHLFASFTAKPEILDTFQFIDSLKIQGQFQLFLHHLFRHVTRSDHFMDPRIRTILKRIEQEPLSTTDATIEHMAEAIGLSRTHYHYLFKKETGISPKQYLLQLRINLAKQDLRQTNLSITEIATMYQFNSIHSFTKLFRKMTGETPTEYRRRNQMV